MISYKTGRNYQPILIYGRDLQSRMMRLERMLKRLETVYPLVKDSCGYCPICGEKRVAGVQPHGTNCEMKALLEGK